MKYRMLSIVLIVIIFLTGSVSFSSSQEVDTPDVVTSITLLSPNSGATTQPYASIMFKELPKVGIGIDNHVSTGWDIIGPRTFRYPADPETGVGIPTYEDGGYDLVFLGLSSSFDYDPTVSYSSQSLSPDGINFAWYRNPKIDDLIENYTTSLNPDERTDIAEDIQKILYKDQPYIPIINHLERWVWDSELDFTAENLLFFTTTHIGDQWKTIDHPSENKIVFVHPYDITEFVPFIQQSYISAQYMNPIFTGLYERDISDRSAEPFYNYKPVIADNQPIWNDDFTEANVTINPNAEFSDGDPVTAWDVVNTYRFHLTLNIASTHFTREIAPYLKPTNNSVTMIDDMTVNFKFVKPYFLAQSIMSMGILNHEVLGNYTSGVQEIFYDGTTMDLGDGPQGKGPNGYDFNSDPLQYGIGAGPFRYKNIDNQTSILTLEKVPDFWNGEVKLDELKFELMTKEEALSQLEVGTVHIIDAQYYIEKAEVQNISGVSSDIVGSFGTNLIAINMEHPVLGTGIDTPLGQEDSTRAAEAARYVRMAISHLVPRNEIINEIYSGMGIAPTSLWPNYAFAYDDSLEPYEYNVEIARQYMEMAGYDISISSDAFDSFIELFPVDIFSVFICLVVLYLYRRN